MDERKKDSKEDLISNGICNMFNAPNIHPNAHSEAFSAKPRFRSHT